MGFDSFLGSGDGGLSGWQLFIWGINRNREHTHKIDDMKNMHKIETHVSTVQQGSTMCLMLQKSMLTMVEQVVVLNFLNVIQNIKLMQF